MQMDNPNQRPPLAESLFSDQKLFQSLSELYNSKNFNRGVLFKNAEFQRQNKKTYVKKTKSQTDVQSAPSSPAPASPNISISLKRSIHEVGEVKQEPTNTTNDEGALSIPSKVIGPSNSSDAVNCFNNININITNTSTNILTHSHRITSALHKSSSESSLNTLMSASVRASAATSPLGSSISSPALSRVGSPACILSTDSMNSPSMGKKRRVSPFGLDVNAKVELTFEESREGCKKMLEYDCYVVCDKCGGSGITNNNDTPTSPSTNSNDINNNNSQGITCQQCNGMLWKTKKRFEVDIPPFGAKNGFKKIYKGLGSKGEDGTLGDLVVEFVVADHPSFRRNETDDTVCDVHISVYQAVLGTKIQIPRVYGKEGEKTELTVNPGIQSHTIIRLPNQGFTKTNCKKKRGDLFVNIIVDIPTHITQQQKELFEKLAAIDSMFDLHQQPQAQVSPPHSPKVSNRRWNNKQTNNNKNSLLDAEQSVQHALLSLSRSPEKAE